MEQLVSLDFLATAPFASNGGFRLSYAFKLPTRSPSNRLCALVHLSGGPLHLARWY